MDQVRIGIIGVGNMGSGHAKTITSGQVPDMVLTAIADINPERRKWAAETYPDVKVFDDAITMMESGLVDAVIVATPHYDHPPLVTAALKRDIHVMCEKPAGVYTLQVREMIAHQQERQDHHQRHQNTADNVPRFLDRSVHVMCLFPLFVSTRPGCGAPRSSRSARTSSRWCRRCPPARR